MPFNLFLIVKLNINVLRFVVTVLPSMTRGIAIKNVGGFWIEECFS